MSEDKAFDLCKTRARTKGNHFRQVDTCRRARVEIARSSINGESIGAVDFTSRAKSLFQYYIGAPVPPLPCNAAINRTNRTVSRTGGNRRLLHHNRSESMTTEHDDEFLEGVWEGVARSAPGANDDGAMDGGSIEVVVRVPPNGSFLGGEDDGVGETGSRLNGALRDELRAI